MDRPLREEEIDRSVGQPPDPNDGCSSGEESPEQQERADSPGPSSASLKSDRSMGHPPELNDGRPLREESPEQQERADSPAPSCASLKIDRSLGQPPEPEDGCSSVEERVTALWVNLLKQNLEAPSRKESPEQQERADSPAPSCASLKIAALWVNLPEPKDGRSSGEEREEFQTDDENRPVAQSSRREQTPLHPAVSP
ncbi:unnamed protein product [Boreogadus saida]